MIDFLRNWVVNIVTLVVFVMLIEMMLPSGKVKKNCKSGYRVYSRDWSYKSCAGVV